MRRSKTQIQREIAETKAHLVDLQEELAKHDREVSRKNQKYRRNKKKLLDIAAPLIENLVEVGDLVEVTGSRAGKYRRIVQINKGRTYGDRFFCGTIHGHLVYDKRVLKDGKTAYERVEDVTKITSHETNKIVAIHRNGEWHRTKDILERLTNGPETTSER